MNKKLQPIKCSVCGKMFLCKGRVALSEGREPFPKSHCLEKTECHCENCHIGNKGDKVCGNVPFIFNPSRRNSEEYD